MNGSVSEAAIQSCKDTSVTGGKSLSGSGSSRLSSLRDPPSPFACINCPSLEVLDFCVLVFGCYSREALFSRQQSGLQYRLPITRDVRGGGRIVLTLTIIC